MFGKKQQKQRENAEFVGELAAQREATQTLVDRYEAEVRTARTAVLAVGKAREERDEYRRVLAAAIATERRREAQVEALEGEQQRLEALASREMRTAAEEGARRKEMASRLRTLEGRLTDELATRERALGDASDRAWAEREAARDELCRVVVSHRQEVTSALGEIKAQIAAWKEGPDSMEEAGATGARGLRARLLIGLSGAATLAAVALIPLAVLSVSDPERALFVHLASGLGPWHLILTVILLGALAVGLLSWAIRDLEAARTAQEENQRELIPFSPVEVKEPAAEPQEPDALRNGSPRP